MTAQIFPGLDKATTYMFIAKVDKVEAITQAVFLYLNVPFEHIASESRHREAVEARQIAMFFLREKTKLTLKQVGSYFGNRDHSTVNYACETVNDLMDSDRRFRAKVMEIGRLL